MEEWIDRLTSTLGEEAVAAREIGAVLKLARDVAHGAERKLAPLSTYVAGLHAARRAAEGMPRERALAEAADAARALITPPVEPD